MNKNRIRLSESQLHQVIKESVGQMLSEADWKTYLNAAEKARLRGDDREGAFRGAAMDNFRNEFGYEEGEYPNRKGVRPNIDLDGYLSGIEAYKDNVPNSWGEHADDWMTYQPDGKLSTDGYHHCEGGGGWNTSIPRDKDEFFKGKDDNALRGAFDRATSEWNNYRNGNYEYEPNGRGWHLKDKMDESIRRAIRNVLR